MTLAFLSSFSMTADSFDSLSARPAVAAISLEAFT
nr:MAG TPA: hypothetical protein [Caudoviricetes sp.]